MAATVKDIAEFIAKVPLFRDLKPKHIDKIAKRMRERDYEKGDAIVEQGTMGIGLFIMVTGISKVIRSHGDGTTREIDTLERYDFFGELSLLDDHVRTASVVADEPVKCLVLAKLDFLDELDEEPEMAIPMLKELAHRFRRIITNM
jgi:CRP/FNR family transcriptional regulator, cyclic AMP receptor protein